MTNTTITKEKQNNMDINITSRDFTLTEGIQNKILHQVKKLNKYAKGNKQTKVNLSTESGRQKVEVMIHINGKLLKAQVVSEDLYEAVDLIVENLKTQLSKFSDKNNNNGRESIRFLQPTSYVDETQIEDNSPKIVKRKLVAAKPMYEEEAVLQMELLNHRSFIFINAVTDQPCMAYKRNDGDYGIIELV